MCVDGWDFENIYSVLPLFVFMADPFADTDDNVGTGAGIQEGLVHIRIQQRNGRKTLTTVQGIHPKFDLKKIVKACKKVL